MAKRSEGIERIIDDTVTIVETRFCAGQDCNARTIFNYCEKCDIKYRPHMYVQN